MLALFDKMKNNYGGRETSPVGQMAQANMVFRALRGRGSMPGRVGIFNMLYTPSNMSLFSGGDYYGNYKPLSQLRINQTTTNK